MTLSNLPLLSKERAGSIRKSLLDREGILRLIIACIALLALAMFFHFREIRVEMLELNGTTDHYVIGTIDFEFPDDEATVILKQDMALMIGRIFQIKVGDLRQARSDFDNFLVHDPSWKKKISKISFEEVYRAMDAVESLLLQARFTDARTIQKIKELEMPIVNYLVFTPPEGDKQVDLPVEYWNHLKESSLGQMIFFRLNTVRPETIDFVVEFFQKRPWTLISDLTTEEQVKEALQRTIPQKYSQVKAGMPIVEKGETITQRHLSMIEAMHDALRKGMPLWAFSTILGNFLLALLFVAVTALYLYSDQKKTFYSLQQLSLSACVLIVTLALCKVTELLIIKNPSTLIASFHYPVIIPFGAFLMTILLNSRIAIFFSFFLSIVASIALAVEHSSFLVINCLCSIVVVHAAKSLRKRKEIFIIISKSLFVAIPLIVALTWMRGSFWSHSLFIDLLGTSILILIVAMLCVAFLPILESLFNVMTDITLMEYMDPSNELLRRLTMEMPGTYQHSLVLGNIAEAAAQSIGAKALFCRVATLYHDIGKLNNVHYFTENQQTGVNIHQLLTPVESAQVIISHVTDGEILARKYHLPQPFIDVILEHHGTTRVFFFYYKELELKGGKAADVDESLFRYPGHKPRSKESAIIMIADASEAASRSLEDLSEQGFINLIDKVVKDRIDDGQFQECPLTFEELEKVKRSIIRTLMVTRHVRVKYPEKV